jgi:hypothetical protein
MPPLIMSIWKLESTATAIYPYQQEIQQEEVEAEKLAALRTMPPLSTTQVRVINETHSPLSLSLR